MAVAEAASSNSRDFLLPDFSASLAGVFPDASSVFGLPPLFRTGTRGGGGLGGWSLPLRDGGRPPDYVSPSEITYLPRRSRISLGDHVSPSEIGRTVRSKRAKRTQWGERVTQRDAA